LVKNPKLMDLGFRRDDGSGCGSFCKIPTCAATTFEALLISKSSSRRMPKFGVVTAYGYYQYPTANSGQFPMTLFEFLPATTRTRIISPHLGHRIRHRHLRARLFAGGWR
jgi:hypothetical protein